MFRGLDRHNSSSASKKHARQKSSYSVQTFKCKVQTLNPACAWLGGSPLGRAGPSFRALSGRLKFTVRRHKSSEDSQCGSGRAHLSCAQQLWPPCARDTRWRSGTPECLPRGRALPVTPNTSPRGGTNKISPQMKLLQILEVVNSTLGSGSHTKNWSHETPLNSCCSPLSLEESNNLAPRQKNARCLVEEDYD